MIELKKINISYLNKKCIVNGNFKASSGNITAIYGESGKGKSSLLYLISMLSEQECEYYINNKKIDYSLEEKEDFRNNYISFITQDSLVIDSLSIKDNIIFYLMQSECKYSESQLLELIGLQDKQHLYPNMLSGGEKQRLAIACAIARDTKIIIGDEITSCNDIENKELIINLLKICAQNGKIVIIVSHEEDILAHCDVIYKIEDSNLILESKENETRIELFDKKRKYKYNKLIELLIISSRKMNIIRIIFSFTIVLCLLIIPILIIQNKSLDEKTEYTFSEISDREIIILNDVQNIYKSEVSDHWLVRPIGGELGINNVTSQKIRNIINIDNVYDYYTFKNGYLSPMGYWNEMSIIVKRGEKIIDKKIFDEEDEIQGYSYDFVVKPFYKEQNRFHNGTEGVYINENIAYVYNIQKGDLLTIEVSVPFASLQSKQESGNSINDVTSKTQEYLSEKVKIDVIVLDIIESNSTYNYENEIYMYHNNMKEIIDTQISKYDNGIIKIDEEAFEGTSEITELTSPLKICFVNRKENVLSVISEIKKINENLVVGYDYIDIQEINDAIDKEYILTAIMVLSIVVISFGVSTILELCFLMKYETLFKTLKLNGFSKRFNKRFFLTHGIIQFMIMALIALVVYIFASIPDIMMILDPINGNEFRNHLPDFLFKLYIYFRFSWNHFLILISFLIINIVISHFVIYTVYNRKDAVLWIRGK